MPLPSNIDISLLHLIEQNPVLYDNNHAKYADANLRELTWTKISEEIELPAKLCKTRWVNMRDHLRRRLRERVTNPTHKPVNKYKYEEEMAFIIPFFHKIELEGSFVDEDDSNSNDPTDSSKGKGEKVEVSKFDNEQDLKLIELIKNHRILYDPSYPKNTDVSIKEVTWEKIADKMGKPGKMCKSRWINIRDAMRRKFKCRQFKTEANKMMKFRYKYEDELSFLMPFYNNLDDSYQSEDNYLEVPDESDHNMNYDSDEAIIEKPDIKFEFRNIELDEMSDHLLETRKRKRKTYDTDEYDDIDTFLMSIGSTLRKLKPLYKNKVKSKIFELVQEYELKQILNSEGHSSVDFE